MSSFAAKQTDTEKHYKYKIIYKIFLMMGM